MLLLPMALNAAAVDVAAGLHVDNDDGLHGDNDGVSREDVNGVNHTFLDKV